jgi:hypothetical protein
VTEQAASTPQPGTPSSQPGAPVPPPVPGQGMGPAPEGMGPAPEGMGPAPKAPSKSSGLVKRIIGILVVAAVVGLGGLAWKYMTGAPETAKVGDCLAGNSEKDLKTVKCDDAKAQHKVVGKLEDKTEAEFDAASDTNPCTAFPTAESAFWEGKKGGKGYILCLEPIKK